MKIAVFGSSGFLGSNFIKNCSQFEFVNFTRINVLNRSYSLNDNIYAVINFVGKAHDLQDSYNENEYYEINTKFCSDLFNDFLVSSAEVFITISSVKAVADELDDILTEEYTPNPISIYGKSKLAAEEYILNREIPYGKRYYILRPCIIHGPGNKGNLNLLYRFVNLGFPWPFGIFDNKISLCSIDNLFYIIEQLICNRETPSGIYNVSDDEPLMIKDIIKLIAVSNNKKVIILNIPSCVLSVISKCGDIFLLPLNSKRFKKLTQNYVVSNSKIKSVINNPFPVSSHDGLLRTFESFNKLI